MAIFLTIDRKDEDGSSNVTLPTTSQPPTTKAPPATTPIGGGKLLRYLHLTAGGSITSSVMYIIT